MTPDQIAALDPNSLANYPHAVPPPGFLPIDRNGLLSCPVQTPPTVLETINLGNMEGWLVLMGLECADFTKGFMQILRGGAPIRDYTRIVTNLGTPETPKQTYIQIVPNQSIVLQFTNTSLAAVSCRWNLFGWYFPRRS
jgi:hypothetical protein